MEDIPQQDLERERIKALATKFEDFCIRAGDRMFSDKISNYKECATPSPENTEERVLVDGKWRRRGVSHPDVVDWSKAKFEDDEYYKKLLEHPAFKEKINGSDVVVDVGNGGNMALRVDAAFLKRNGFMGKVIGVDPFRNENEINTENDLHTEAVKQDGLSYLLEQADGSGNILCSNLEREIISNREYAEALVKEIFRTIPEAGLFICIHSDALHDIAKSIFPYVYEIKDNAYSYIFSKTPISGQEQTK